jgi:hypothetical protein
MNRFMLPPRRNPMLQCRKFLRLGNLRVFTQSRPISDQCLSDQAATATSEKGDGILLPD